MKYWKNGFYEQPQSDAVEITDGYWQELLLGQSNGLRVAEDNTGYPVLFSSGPSTLEEIREDLLLKVNAYDKSTSVNEFYIKGIFMWLDKETRVGLKLRFEAELASGIESTVLWYNGQSISLEIQSAITMLLTLEVYASKCYDVTQQHIANVNRLESAEELIDYDFTTGYPTKINL